MATQAIKARILYDFDGDTENGELIIKEGDIITVLNQDVGDGWWEGQLHNGDQGLFPESYVELLQDGDDGDAMLEDGDQFDESYQQERYGQETENYQQKWDDEDDDDDWDQQPQDGYDEYVSGVPVGQDERGRDSNSPGAHSNQFARAGTVRKNINRFSPFVKTGTEAFVLGRAIVKTGISDTDRLKIIYSPEGTPMWEPNPDPFTIEVKDPEKKSKFKGIKSFTAYNVIPSSTGRAVSRRYKHYDWLHERLVEKFTLNSVPPLPDKQYYGRYGEDFVEKRREKLQRWSNRIARHPVLSRSEVVSHFFLCDDTASQWKAGKRRAEKDELIAGAFVHTVEHPNVTVDISQADERVEVFGAFLKHMKLSLSKMRVKFIDHCNQMSGPFVAEFHKMSGVINGVAQTFSLEKEEYAKSLTSAMQFTADTYREIGDMYADQPRNDMLPSLDVIKEYLGLIHTFPEVVHVHKGAVSKVNDCDKMKEEGRIDMTDATEITSRSETISTAVLAEMYHFHHERVVDFREMMKYFLNEQISFYKEIVSKLEVAVQRYDDGTDL